MPDECSPRISQFPNEKTVLFHKKHRGVSEEMVVRPEAPEHWREGIEIVRPHQAETSRNERGYRFLSGDNSLLPPRLSSGTGAETKKKGET